MRGIQNKRQRGEGGERPESHPEKGPGPGRGGGDRSRKDHHGPGGAGPDPQPARGGDRGADHSGRPGRADQGRQIPAGNPRQAGVHDLPGPHDLLKPGAARERADRRGDPHPQQTAQTQGSPGSCRGHAGAGGNPEGPGRGSPSPWPATRTC